MIKLILINAETKVIMKIFVTLRQLVFDCILCYSLSVFIHTSCSTTIIYY